MTEIQIALIKLIDHYYQLKLGKVYKDLSQKLI